VDLVVLLAGLPVEIVADVQAERPERREEAQADARAQTQVGRVEVLPEPVGVPGVEEQREPEPRETGISSSR
jgi:hypothetical protein